MALKEVQVAPVEPLPGKELVVLVVLLRLCQDHRQAIELRVHPKQDTPQAYPEVAVAVQERPSHSQQSHKCPTPNSN